MHRFDRLLWRLAGRLETRLARLDPQTIPEHLDHSSWLAARHLESQLTEISARRWAVALDYLVVRFEYTMRQLQRNLEQLQLSVSSRFSQPELARQRQLYEELQATFDSFPDSTFDLRQQTLTVITEPVTLEEISLGRFQIVLNLEKLGKKATYRVVAESPNFSESRRGVSHPHVLDEVLCEGDAQASLACALRTGRFSDFFQIIVQVLNTYNSHSAYSSLSEWESHYTCHACGDSVSEDDSSYCDTCHASTCDHCSTCCPHCGDSACDVCIQHCEKCGESACMACLKEVHKACVAVAQTV